MHPSVFPWLALTAYGYGWVVSLLTLFGSPLLGVVGLVAFSVGIGLSISALVSARASPAERLSRAALTLFTGCVCVVTVGIGASQAWHSFVTWW
jgi:hypothetical protein